MGRYTKHKISLVIMKSFFSIFLPYLLPNSYWKLVVSLQTDYFEGYTYILGLCQVIAVFSLLAVIL